MSGPSAELLERTLRHVVKMFVRGTLVYRDRVETTPWDAKGRAAKLRKADLRWT